MKKSFVSKYIFILTLIFIFGVGIRIYYASKQKDIYWDEHTGLVLIFTQDISGKDVNGIGFQELMKKENNTFSNYIDDILKMYRYSGDPFISNLYYTFLRTAMLFRTQYSTEEIIILGTILNCIFFAISFIFMEKLLNLFISDSYIIAFTLFCVSLIPSSITFSMFLRPYQMQETFFIVSSYLIVYIFLLNKISIKYLLITTVVVSLGYLILYSSIIYVLLLSFVVFVLFILNLVHIIKNRQYNTIQYNTIQYNTIQYNTIQYNTIQYNFKKLIFFAASFISAFLVSQLFYGSFLQSLFTANERSNSTFKYPSLALGFINSLCFIDLLIPIVFFMFTYLCYKIYKKSRIDIIKITPLLLIIGIAILYSIYADMASPYKYPRYSVGTFPLLFLILPAFLTLVDEKKLRISIMIIISFLYLHGIITPKRFDYFEDKNSYYSSENLLYYHNSEKIYMYGIEGYLGYHNNSILGGTAETTYIKIKNYKQLKKQIEIDAPDRFFVINNKDLSLEMNNNFLEATEGYTNIRKTYNNRYIFEFLKE